MINCFCDRSSQKMKFLFVVLLVVFPSSVLGRRRKGKVVTVESFNWNMDAPSDYRPGKKLPVRIDFVAQIDSQSNSVNGGNLWRLGIFGNEHNDGHGERVGYKSQILQRRQISKSATSGQPLKMRNILTRFDLTQIGCSDLPYLCVEFAKNSDSTVDFELRSGSASDSIVSCQELECRRPNTDIASLGGREALRESNPNVFETGEKEFLPIIPSAYVEDYNVCYGRDNCLAKFRIKLTLILHSASTAIRGTGLWKLEVFLTDAGAKKKNQIHPDILNETQKAIPFVKGKPLKIPAVIVELNTSGVGCPESDLQMFCFEFGKGENPDPPFVLLGGPYLNCYRLECRYPKPKRSLVDEIFGIDK